MNNLLLSIIVPAYNSEKYIAHCLDSILSQTYQNYEIIIVNDGSKDGTAKIINRYATEHDRVSVIHQENCGVTHARLNGVAHASGEYIGFVDSDDEIEPDMYELLVGNALKYNADISHCGYSMVFPSRVTPYYGTGLIAEQDNRKGLLDLFDGSRIEPGLWNKLYHKTLFHSLLHEDVMDFSIKINEDLLMNYYLFRESKKSIFEDVCKYHYLVHEGSAANANINRNKLEDPLKVRKILLKETVDNPECQYVLKRNIAGCLISLATMSAKADFELISPIRKEARCELRELVPEILKKHSTSLKIKALWAAYLPTSYRWVHDIYLKITGLDKIYEIS